MGIALSAVGEGLREAARHFGGVALCRVRLPLPPAGGRHSQRGFITRSRVCLTRGCACVIPYGEGNHGRHHHGPAGKDALNAWVLEKVRASYLSVRNNRSNLMRPA